MNIKKLFTILAIGITAPALSVGQEQTPPVEPPKAPPRVEAPVAARQNIRMPSRGRGSYEGQARFTFSGRLGTRIDVIDNASGQVETNSTRLRALNLQSPQARAREAARKKELRDTVDEMDEAKAEVAATAADAASEAQALAAAEAAEIAANAIDVTAGVRMLREQNWITYTEDDSNFPETVFNPFTKQFVPTMDAIRSLQNPPTVGQTEGTSGASTPPPARDQTQD